MPSKGSLDLSLFGFHQKVEIILTARILAPKMSTILGVPIQVINKPGGSGIIGTLEAVKSPPELEQHFRASLQGSGGPMLIFIQPYPLPSSNHPKRESG